MIAINKMRGESVEGDAAAEEVPIPTDSELQDAMTKKYPIAEDEKQVNEFVLPVKTNDFYKDIYADGAPHAFEKYFEHRGEKEIVCQPWENGVREVNMTIGIKGVPFCSSSK